jgi:hypothetical protein
MLRFRARTLVLSLLAAVTACLAVLASGGLQHADAGSPNPCDLVSEDEIEGILGLPLAEDPEYAEAFGIQVCNWRAVPDEFNHSPQAGLQLASGTDEQMDFLYDGTIAPYEEEIDGLGDRAKWVSQVIWIHRMWGELRIRAGQYYISIYVDKYEPEFLSSPTEAQEEMLEMAKIVLDKLKPRAPVEFTQAIQELQENYELVADLELHGEPPVPIVAGKPAVARVYFDEDSQGETRTAELSDVASAAATVTVGQACTVEKQRRQDDGCMSADLYFTPPEGEWTATITIKDGSGAQLDQMEFTMTSVETDLLKIRALSVCDAKVDDVWDCGSTTKFAGLLSFIRATFPGDVQMIQRLTQVQREVATTNPASGWWNAVVSDLRDMWIAAGKPADEYFYGVVRGAAGSGTAAGNTGGIAYRPGHAGASRTFALRSSVSGGQRDTAAEVIAHEIGHNIGRKHVPSPPSEGCYNQPSGLDTNWPNGSSPFIEEIGFDVPNQKAITDDDHADWETYCTARWISIYTYEALIDEFRSTSSPASITTGTTGSYWLVSGSIEGFSANFGPVLELEATAETGTGSGGYRIEVKDGGGGTLFTRLFTPGDAHSEDVTFSPSFAELIPVSPDAKTIQVYAPDNSLLGMITLEGEAPSVDASVSPGTAGAGNVITVDWTVTDPDSAEHTAWVEFSADGGATWETVAVGTRGDQLSVDGAFFPGTAEGMFRVRVSDGVNTGVGTSELFALPEKTPEAAITFPGGGDVYHAGSLVWLQGFANDAEDGNLDEDIMWTSSRDGMLGTGASLPVYDLSVGSHTVTLTVSDSDNNETSDSITITVAAGGSGDQLIWGDNNCSGSVDPVDGLLELRFDAGLSANTNECPDMGQVVEAAGASPHPWGDVDCDGQAGPVDSLKLLRHDAGLSVGQEPECPAIGSAVLVST